MGVIIYTAAQVIEYSTCERRRKWGEFWLNCEEPSCKNVAELELRATLEKDHLDRMSSQDQNH